MKTIAFIILYFICKYNIYSQSNYLEVDSNFLRFNAKMLVFTEYFASQAYSKSEVLDFVNYSDTLFEITFLDNKGFNNIQFISITAQKIIIDSSYFYFHLNHPRSTKFILGVDLLTNRIFRITGFQSNDIHTLLTIVYYRFESESEKREFRNKKKFVKKYSINTISSSYLANYLKGNVQSSNPR